MKILKYIILIFSILNLFQYSQSQSLDSTQLSAAKDILNTLGYSAYDPCSYPGFFTCETVNSKLSVVTISIGYPGSNITTDLTAFPDLKLVFFGSYFDYIATLPPSFFNKIDKFTKLESVDIGYQLTSINESAILPSSLKSWRVQNAGAKFGINFFNSSLTNIVIENSLPGFELPSSLAYNSALVELSLPFNKIPNGSQFPSLKTLILRIPINAELIKSNAYDDIGSSIESYSNISKLDLRTTGSFPNYRILLPSFQSFNNLEYLYISGSSFGVNPGSVVLDLSNSQKLTQLIIEQSSILRSCTGSPCIKLSSSSSVALTTSIANYNISLLDYSNLNYVSISYNYFIQTLPELPSIDLEFKLWRSKIIGNIPSSYCHSRRYLYLGDNNIRGTVPSCFKCNLDSNIFSGNSFSNHNSSNTTPSCPSFYVNSLDYYPIVKTDGSTRITLTGRDIGIGISTTYLDEEYYYYFRPSYNPIIPNQIIEFIPGKGYSKNITATLQFDYPGASINFEFSYEEPVVESYIINNDINGEYANIIIKGQGFNYLTENEIYINNNYYSGSIANNGESVIYDSNVFESIQSGDTFQVYVNVYNQQSKVVRFLYLQDPNEIFINPNSIPQLNINGGTLIIEGSFYTSDISLISIKINDQICNITQFTNNSMVIEYPSTQDININNSTLILNIGGHLIKSNVSFKTDQDSSSDSNSSNSSIDSSESSSSDSNSSSNGSIDSSESSSDSSNSSVDSSGSSSDSNSSIDSSESSNNHSSNENSSSDNSNGSIDNSSSSNNSNSSNENSSSSSDNNSSTSSIDNSSIDSSASSSDNNNSSIDSSESSSSSSSSSNDNSTSSSSNGSSIDNSASSSSDNNNSSIDYSTSINNSGSKDSSSSISIDNNNSSNEAPSL